LGVAADLASSGLGVEGAAAAVGAAEAATTEGGEAEAGGAWAAAAVYWAGRGMPKSSTQDRTRQQAVQRGRSPRNLSCTIPLVSESLLKSLLQLFVAGLEVKTAIKGHLGFVELAEAQGGHCLAQPAFGELGVQKGAALTVCPSLGPLA